MEQFDYAISPQEIAANLTGSSKLAAPDIDHFSGRRILFFSSIRVLIF